MGEVSEPMEEICAMGANSKQGWYLFLFLVGFTFLPAGLIYLGYLFALVGLVCLIVSTVGFIQIKPLEHASPASQPQPAPTITSAAPAKRAV